MRVSSRVKAQPAAITWCTVAAHLLEIVVRYDAIAVVIQGLVGAAELRSGTMKLGSPWVY